MSEKLSNEDSKYLLSLIKEDKIVEAVKFVREKTDMSLLKAKEYVDRKRIDENAEFSENDNISEDEKNYIISLIEENKKLQAVAFLHKNKNMSLLEAKNYVDRIAPIQEKETIEVKAYHIDNSTNKNANNLAENKQKRGYIFDKKLNIYVPDLNRQRKINKIVLSILLILIVLSLIQLCFLDRTSFTQMIFFAFSSVFILPLLIIWIGVSLNIHFIEKYLKQLEEIELSNEFEIKSLKKNFILFFNFLASIALILISYIQIERLINAPSLKNIFYAILLVGTLIYNCYTFFKGLKNRKYSLNINGKTIRILYKNSEMECIKTDNIDFVKFYAIYLGKGHSENKPTVQIFDKNQKKLVEMTMSIKDYYLLKKYFERYDVVVKDEFTIF